MQEEQKQDAFKSFREKLRANEDTLSKLDETIRESQNERQVEKTESGLSLPGDVII